MGLDDPEVIRQYIQGVYNTILVKDIVSRKKVRNVLFLENLVYQHLIRLGYKVNVGQMYATEIDFVGTKGDDTIYVQASYLITEESTFEREFGNLKKINDNYPKYVISMTPFLDYSKYEGIIHIPLAEFLKK